MKNEKTTNKTTENSAFESLKTGLENAIMENAANGTDYGAELSELSTAIAFSTVRKLIDPQSKNAARRDDVSNSGFSPAMVAIRRGIAADRALLDNTARNANAATVTELDKNGDMVTNIANADANENANNLIQKCLSDGIDLVQSAALALLEEIARAGGVSAVYPGWLDTVYTDRKLSKRVYIRLSDSAAYADVETTPIQEACRAVRRAVQNSRAVNADPRCKYVYISDEVKDGEDIDRIYYRMPKYSDIGGYAHNGRYSDRIPGSPAGYESEGDVVTGDIETARGMNEITEKLNLTIRQKGILTLRLQGWGQRAIATYLGVKPQAIQKAVYSMRKKCYEIGLDPEKHGIKIEK